MLQLECVGSQSSSTSEMNELLHVVQKFMMHGESSRMQQMLSYLFVIITFVYVCWRIRQWLVGRNYSAYFARKHVWVVGASSGIGIAFLQIHLSYDLIFNSYP